jgi:hypothetical protein
MARTENLPVFESELVDGGLQVNVSNVTGDLVLVIGFGAEGHTYADDYINQPIRINKGDEAEFVYGLASNNSSLTQAIYEVLGAGANTVFGFNLGQWGTATYTDPATDIVYPLFTSLGGSPELFEINTANYYKALGYAYELLKNWNADVIYPADAYAFDAVTPVSGRPTNFGYQAAFAAYEMSSQNNEVIVVMNVEPAASGTLSYVADYIGTLPTTNVLGVITQNGTGLLGEPYLVGEVGNVVLPGFYASNFDGDDSKYGLPPLATTEILLDRKNNRVDIGRYLSIVAEQPTYSNGAFTTGGGAATYTGLGGSAYAGLVSTLVPHSAPTNKIVPGISTLYYSKSLSQLDKLAGARYVTFRRTNRGILVTDSPTAARPGSDYNRLQVMRIVNAVMKMTRLVADPFIGEPNSDAMRNALQTALDKQYKKFCTTGALRQYDFKVVASDADRVLGNMNIELTLVPEFETRRIRAVVVIKPNI